jgi:hypothetical protein
LKPSRFVATGMAQPRRALAISRNPASPSMCLNQRGNCFSNLFTPPYSPRFPSISRRTSLISSNTSKSVNSPFLTSTRRELRLLDEPPADRLRCTLVV